MQDYTIPISPRWCWKPFIVWTTLWILLHVFGYIAGVYSLGWAIEELYLMLYIGSIFLLGTGIPIYLFALYFHSHASYILTERGMIVTEVWSPIQLGPRKRVVPYSLLRELKVQPGIEDRLLNINTIELAYNDSFNDTGMRIRWPLGRGAIAVKELVLMSVGAATSPARFPVAPDHVQSVLDQLRSRAPQLQ